MAAPLIELKLIAVVNTLRSCQLFTGLPPADLENIAAVSIVKSLEKDDYLFHEGDPAHGFYVVQRGAVNVHRVNAAGKEQIIHVFRAGDSFAEVALASSTGYPADARVIEPSIRRASSGCRLSSARMPTFCTSNTCVGSSARASAG